MEVRARQLLPAASLASNSFAASASGHQLDSVLANWINTANTNVYDKAIDSIYLAQGTGGSRLHHLIDGQHDLLGAFSAARKALPDDSHGAELLGTAHHLGKDLFSVMGLPLFSLKPETFASASDWMSQHLGLSKSWQADLLQINGTELLGGALAAASLTLGIRQADAEQLSEIAGASGLAGALAANPLSLLAAGLALADAWKYRQENGSLPWRGLALGSASAGAAIATASALGTFAAGGWLPLLSSFGLSLIAGLATKMLLTRFLRSPQGLVSDAPATKPTGLLIVARPLFSQTPESIDAWLSDLRPSLNPQLA